MTKRVTIRSVAREAGVSVSTVSNVLNGRHAEMTDETRQRVLATIERLDYRPNRLAQSLATNRTRTIALVISELTNSLYPPVLLGAEAACRAAGYDLLLANAPDVDAERRTVEVLLDKRVDGLILFSASVLNIDNEHLLRAQRAGLPVVVINRHLPDNAPMEQIRFDHRGGALLATDHLLALGHRRVAHIAGPVGRFTGVLRRAGYEAALRQAGIEPETGLVAVGDYSFNSGHAALLAIWPQRPSAVFVGGDVMALGALRAARDLGLRVPGDLSLVAFGNPDSVRYATPGITTIDLPVVEAGRMAAASILHSAGDGRGQAKEARTLETTLLIRETTASRQRGREAAPAAKEQPR
ncbi:MAG TPA: LacI family DNA-binding transcriptional regulator [Thermomicrobiales bacterium]|jgi:LacI family repressor for deo operon, udp, cdd, tsx, nupC, and nupG|nr:LacI family DNA-binding transcriptional regulator [Thermomicrobiales bacterium]